MALTQDLKLPRKKKWRKEGCCLQGEKKMGDSVADPVRICYLDIKSYALRLVTRLDAAAENGRHQATACGRCEMQHIVLYDKT